MKKRFHSIAAVLGVFCAIGFAMVPFTAGADIGPNHSLPKAKEPIAHSAPPSAAVAPRAENRGSHKMHINRPDVRNDDGGCG